MDTLFVTGGTGFLGRHLVPTLINAGYHVRLLVRHPARHEWLRHYPQVEIVQGDIQDAAIVTRGAQGARSIIHAAGVFRFWGDEAEFDRVNVGGAENVLLACKAAGCERLIHISSVYLIGQPPRDQVIDETYPAHPVEPYQRSKLKAEQRMLRAHAEQGIPVVVLRPGAFYGPYGGYAFNRLFFRDPMRGIIMQLNGGRYIILPVFVPDVAQGALLALTHGRAGEIYNICDHPIAHRDAYDIVTEEAKLWFPRLRLPDWVGLVASHVLEAVARVTRVEPFYPLNLRSYVYNYWRVSHEKAARELGFVPTPFREGARQTIAWYKAGRPNEM
ncbi:MAG: NAD-dependent epimerase/dehydratase family protein [Chloroflexota bacterium]|nr:NAD-dependent epimerase/dehydratase family protein [Chloroflexota bacterium]